MAQKAADENALLEAQAMTDLYLEQLDVANAEGDLETVMWLLGEIGKYAGLLFAQQEKADEAAAYEAEQALKAEEEAKAAREQAALEEEAERLRLENQDALLEEMQAEKALATAAYNAKYEELYNTYYYIWETDFWFEYEGDELEAMHAMEDDLDVLQDDLNYWAAQVNMILTEKSKREQAALDAEAAQLAAQQAYDAEQKAKAAEEKRLAAEAEAEALRLQQEAEAAERDALRLAQEEEQKKLDRKLRDIDNLPEDERNALLAEVLQQKIDVALVEFSDEFWTQANREIDNFWWMVDRQHELKYEYIVSLQDEINGGWADYDFMSQETWAMYDQYNVLSNELWSADTYEWVDWIGEELSSLAKQIERQEKTLNNQLQYVQSMEADLNALQNDGYIEDLQAEVDFRSTYVTRLNEVITEKRTEIETLEGDDKGVAQALMEWVIERRDEQA